MGALNEPAHRCQTVRVDEDVGALRRVVARTAAGVTGVRAGDAALAATELATNIVRHAPAGGHLLFRPLPGAIELIAVDRGPGMGRQGTGEQPASAPPPGTGLGVGLAGVERLASTFDLYSAEGRGTVVLARLGSPPRTATGPFRWGAVNVPLGGDGESGDAWAVAPDGRLAALLVDGLGHGVPAHEASAAAIAQLGEGPPSDLAGFVRRAHDAMRHTRGGVLGLALIDPEDRQVSYAGVGNVAGQVLREGTSFRLLNREGTVGTEPRVPNVRLARHGWEAGATLVLMSDGVHAHVDLLSTPGLLRHDPAVVAAAVHREGARNTDDATVLVVQDVRGRAG